jgi:hypothetical protein
MKNEVNYKNPNWITNEFEHYQNLISCLKSKKPFANKQLHEFCYGFLCIKDKFIQGFFIYQKIFDPELHSEKFWRKFIVQQG